MFTLTRLRLPIVVIVGLAFATLLALAAFTSAEAAEQKDAVAKEQTDAAAQEEEGPITIENHSWGNYHWGTTSTPFTLKVGDNLTSTWDPHLDEAIRDWTQSSVLDLTEVAGQTSPRKCAPTSGQIAVCNEKYGFNGWLGIAQIWVSGNHITRGNTKVNDSYFNTARYNTPAWRQFVMCQEIGHDFGLGHTDENFNNTNGGTCMDYTNDPSGTAGSNGDQSNLHPNAHDFAQLESIYAHKDGSNTYSAQTTDTGTRGRGNNESGDTHSDLGQEIWRAANGRASLFEKTLPNNEKKVTHVLWSLERAEKLQGNHKHQDEH
jgi:hypothetical protein